ncbi:CsbD family protein [Celeribacter litoreus]|uniref:CsbD family protein n=1 Tax=Celeribacter litoreus TaxID=2876714 RepID=UPI001CC9125F|nr:CsbD family protein [Celeribacter litoreus]MCA0042703.1 CsbD family protein [Celeribacter litoreus]
MRWTAIEGKWFRFKSKAKQEWSELTEADLDEVEGDRDRLVQLVAKAYGKTPGEARMEVSSWKERVAAI